MTVNIKHEHVCKKFCPIQAHNLISVKLSQAHDLLTAEQQPMHDRVTQARDT